MERTVYRETLDGCKYEFIEMMMFGKPYVISSCYFDYNKRYNHIGLNFNTIEEALEWCDKKDYNYQHPAPVKPFTYEVPSDYYGVRGRYYGD